MSEKEEDLKKKNRIILFLLIFVLLMGTCSAGIQIVAKNINGSVSGRSRVFASVSAEKEHTIDLLVAGDSESYTSVSPMDLWDKTGIAAYDCGQPGQRIQETYYVLKTAFRTQSPKMVLLETNTMFRDPGFLKNLQMSLRGKHCLTVRAYCKMHIKALRYEIKSYRMRAMRNI